MEPLYTFERAELERIARLQQRIASKDKMTAAGFVEVSGWVHPHQAFDVTVLMHRLQADPKLMVGPVRHEMTGKLQKLR